MNTRLAIEIAEKNLEATTRAHLQARGWKYTCQTPGSIWLYQKVFRDGRCILANHALALQIQDYSDREYDPNDAFRWVCPECTTVNGIDDLVCLGGSCGRTRPPMTITMKNDIISAKGAFAFDGFIEEGK